MTDILRMSDFGIGVCDVMSFQELRGKEGANQSPEFLLLVTTRWFHNYLHITHE